MNRLLDIRLDSGVTFDHLASVYEEYTGKIALENLLGNAWKFTSKHPRVTIEFGQTQYDGKTAYFVRDDGAGFNPAFAGKLFGAFQRLHKEKDFPGTELDFCGVYRLSKDGDSEVWVRPLADGSTLTIIAAATFGSRMLDTSR